MRSWHVAGERRSTWIALLPGLVLAVILAVSAVRGDPLLRADASPADGALPPGAITFGAPLVVRGEGSAILVPVTNTTANVASFTVTASLVRGEQTVGVVAGAVNDLRPHQTRVADLLALDGLPRAYDAIRVALDQAVVFAPTTPTAKIASAIRLGPLPADSIASDGAIRVLVTNSDRQPHTFTVQAAFFRDGHLIGDAVGEVDRLGPGQTTDARLLPLGRTTNYDRVSVAVDSVAE